MPTGNPNQTEPATLSPPLPGALTSEPGQPAGPAWAFPRLSGLAGLICTFTVPGSEVGARDAEVTRRQARETLGNWRGVVSLWVFIPCRSSVRAPRRRRGPHTREPAPVTGRRALAQRTSRRRRTRAAHPREGRRSSVHMAPSSSSGPGSDSRDQGSGREHRPHAPAPDISTAAHPQAQPLWPWASTCQGALHRALGSWTSRAGWSWAHPLLHWLSHTHGRSKVPSSGKPSLTGRCVPFPVWSLRPALPSTQHR